MLTGTASYAVVFTPFEPTVRDLLSRMALLGPPRPEDVKDKEVWYFGQAGAFHQPLSAELIGSEHYTVLSLVRARRNVPGTMVKARMLAAVRDNPDGYLSREAKAELRTSIVDDLRQTTPVEYKAIPLLVLSSGLMLVGTTSDAVLDVLHALLCKAADRPLPDGRYYIEHRITELRRDDTRPLRIGDAAAVELDLAGEFMLWLWYRSEISGADNKIFGLAVDGPVLLRGPGAAQKVTVAAGAPTMSPECNCALRSGKLPTRYRLLLVSGPPKYSPRYVTADKEPDVVYSLTLDAAGSRITGFRPPASESLNKDERAEHRYTTLVRAFEYIQAYVDLFRVERFSTQWPEVESDMSRWVMTRGGHLEPGDVRD